MHGGVSREQRRRIMAAFRSGAYDFVLANRVACEGLDFEFCSAVGQLRPAVEPMEIEQRIGRIDRIGQKEETILVVNFVNEAIIDERILSRLLDRIGIFESSIGALEPIIAAAAAKALEAGFDFTLTPAQREQKLYEALTAIEEQRAGLQDLSDASSALLVSNDVDVAGREDELVHHWRSAFPSGSMNRTEVQLSLAGQALSPIYTPKLTMFDEKSGLAWRGYSPTRVTSATRYCDQILRELSIQPTIHNPDTCSRKMEARGGPNGHRTPISSRFENLRSSRHAPLAPPFVRTRWHYRLGRGERRRLLRDSHNLSPVGAD